MMACRLLIALIFTSLIYNQVDGRVIPQPIRSALAGQRRSLAQHGVLENGNTQPGQTIPGRFIVVYKREAGDADAATQRLISHIRSTTLNAMAVDDSTTAGLKYSILGAAAQPQTPESDDLITAESAAVSSPLKSSSVQAIVVDDVTATSLAAIQQSPNVQVVFPDTTVSANQVEPTQSPEMPESARRMCLNTAAISAGVESTTATAAARLAPYWPHKDCMQNTKTVWVGERCLQDSSFSKVQYKAIYAVDRSSGEVKRTPANAACEIFPTANAQRTASIFGTCGKAPAIAQDLLTDVCSTAGCMSPKVSTAQAGSTARLTAQLTLKTAVKCSNSGRHAAAFTYIGQPCGPSNQYVRWVRAVAPDGCVIARSNARAQLKNALDVFGSCGAGPALSYQHVAMSVCTSTDTNPPPSNPKPTDTNPLGWVPISKTAVASGEDVPSGIKMIEVVQKDMVADITKVSEGQRVLVGVVDSGVDGTHPDINYAGGKSWVITAPDESPGVDRYGHGTHVAGIIGAKNGHGSQGVLGVSPGTGIFSLKVLDGNGSGMLSKTLEALRWVATEGVKQGIKVVNLSLVAQYDPSSPNFPQIVEAVCQFFKEASDAGVSVVVSAGNFGKPITSYVPAVCPTVITVTALDQTGSNPATWSNYAAADNTAQKEHTIAAPGTSILSTVPKSVDKTGYVQLGGTSMASPHVAGVVANCIMSGECNSATGAGNIPKLIQGAQYRYKKGTYARYDPIALTGSKYYGYLTWAGY